MIKIVGKELMDLFKCLTISGLIDEKIFKEECKRWINSSTAKEEVLDFVKEMLNDEDDTQIITTLANLETKISNMQESEVQETLKKYINHFAFFENPYMATKN